MKSQKCFIAFILWITLFAFQALAVTNIPNAPAPFNGTKTIKIALIQLLIEGEFMQTFRSGAEKQAQLMGIELLALNNKNASNEAQADAVERAISLGVDGILLSHGRRETMKDPIERAIAAGIQVVAFDIDMKNPAVTQIAQDDRLLGQMALDAMVKDFNGKANVGYIYVPGVLPLDKRDASFTKTKEKYPGIVEVARTGTLESPFSTKNADQVKAVLRANPEINAYFAPYDEFAKGVLLALNEVGMAEQVKVYSADISTVDIRLMTKPNSPWAATAATNPAAIGATGVRAVAMKIAGEPLPKEITIPPMLFTQKMLRDAKITKFSELQKKFPQFSTVDRASAPWIPRDEQGKY